MNSSPITKGTKQKRNEIRSNTPQCRGTTLSSVAFHSVSKPSPVLSDRKEFPSLNESSGKELKDLHSENILRYSDKLKSRSVPNNQNTLSGIHSKCDTIISTTLNQYSDINHNSKTSNKQNPVGNKIFNEREKSQNQIYCKKTECLNKVDAFPNQIISTKLLNKSPKEYNLNNQLSHGHQKELFKQESVENSLKFSRNSATLKNSKSICSNYATSNNQISNKSGKFLEEKGELKEKNDDNLQNKEKKKKKRKSKVKRQVIFQKGKITVLTPEVHLKILNQTSAIIPHSSKNIVTDINDEEEYPELGKTSFQLSQKATNIKKDIQPAKELTNKPSESCTDDATPVAEDHKESAVIGISQKPASEKKGKSDAKNTVHPKDPITISFYDIILNKNSKPNNVKDEVRISDSTGQNKIKIRKDISRPLNLLDSSSPFVKRGKEREKPKPKKPSQLKKIILLDRKKRKEQLLNLKTNNNVVNVIDTELVNKLNKNESESESDAAETTFPAKSKFDIAENTDKAFLLISDNSSVPICKEVTYNQTLMSPINNEDNLEDELIPEMKQLNVSELSEHSAIENYLSSNTLDSGKESDCTEDFLLSLDKKHENKNSTTVLEKPVLSLNVSQSPDLVLNNLMKCVKKSEVSDKEKAAKILLHTRNFREYCNHLISKDIDDAVFSLLDDLARFQDRLHQKDPVKARMKRRLINGIKEVKKHIKLQKLKCIIIAVDIENVETQGGLNDALNDIKISAAEHHIPCVFALSRKILGKVCRKPVPISCVGVLNFEGSEVNFKKMVELQAQSKEDYNEMFSKLSLRLTDEEASLLLKAKAEAPETLQAIRADILNDIFMKSEPDIVENENMDVISNQISNLEAL